MAFNNRRQNDDICDRIARNIEDWTRELSKLGRDQQSLFAKKRRLEEQIRQLRAGLDELGAINLDRFQEPDQRRQERRRTLARLNGAFRKLGRLGAVSEAMSSIALESLTTKRVLEARKNLRDLTAELEETLALIEQNDDRHQDITRLLHEAGQAADRHDCDPARVNRFGG